MFAVSHLTPAPFTQEVVRALLEGGEKVSFFTTLTPDGQDWAARGLRILRGGGSRRLANLPAGIAQTYPWREVMRLALGRCSVGETTTDRVFHWARDGFDAWVARHMCAPFQLIYGYETECLETFRAAKAAGIRRVLDLPSPEHDFVENLLRAERERFPELQSPARKRLDAFQPERTARRHEEFKLANLVCANSTFTRDTWISAGLDGTKIITLPLGAPTPDVRGADGGSRGSGPLRLVWAGTFSVRKGAHYLLEAWQSCRPPHAQLDVYGTVSLPTALTRNLPAGVTFHGPVPRTRVLTAFSAADALVFPTLCDGFGLVVNEALSRGLPVITTQRAGAADLVEHGRNGLIIPAASSESLVAALEWCATHRDCLREMRTAALQSAMRWQWGDYRQALRKALRAPNRT